MKLNHSNQSMIIVMVTKSIFTFLFCSILLFIHISCASMLGIDREAGEELYKTGMQQLENGKTDAALHSFLYATQKYRSHAEAYYQLAKLYLAKDTIQGIVLADKALQNAVRYDPDNIEYRMALANLTLERELTASAKNEYKRILELDSTNAEAWYSLGFIHEQEMLHLQHLVSPDSSNGVIIYFTKFANKELEKCLHDYKKAIENDRTLLHTYYRLGFIYYELKQWDKMISVFRDAITEKPNDKNSHLYLALAYHRNQEYRLANHEYQLAWQYMNDEERRFYTSIEPLLAKKNDGASEKEGDEYDHQYEYAFWKSRDPLYLTDYNERLLEHFARIAYANLRYSNPKKGVEGWQTDMGKVYIRYGPPKNQFRTRAWINMGHAAGTSPLVTSKETWKYPGFQFVFEDRFLQRNYTFKWGYTPYDDYLEIYNRTIKILPEYYQPDFGGKTFPIPVLTQQYALPDSQKSVYVYSGIPVDSVNHTESFSNKKVTADLQKGIFVFDRDWQPLVQKKSNPVLETGTKLKFGQYLFLDSDSLQLPAGIHNVAIEFLDQERKNLGQYRDTLHVCAIGSNQLALSDLLLANRIQSKTDISKIDHNKIIVTPNFDYTFQPEQDLYLYYEIYNLILDKTKQSNYRVSHSIRNLDEQGSIVSKFLTALRLKKKISSEIVTTFDYQSRDAKENHYRLIQLNDYEPGRYQLKVKVEDLNSGQSAAKSILFEIQRHEE